MQKFKLSYDDYNITKSIIDDKTKKSTLYVKNF